MNRHAIWISSLVVLILICLVYSKGTREGFADVTLTTARASVTAANTAFIKANSSVDTANTAITNATTIPLAKTAIDKAKTAVTDADAAVTKAATAVSDANALVSAAQANLSPTPINDLITFRDTASRNYTVEKAKDTAKATALTEWNNATAEQTAANNAVSTAQSEYNTENGKTSGFEEERQRYAEIVDSNYANWDKYNGDEGAAELATWREVARTGRYMGYGFSQSQASQTVRFIESEIEKWKKSDNPYSTALAAMNAAQAKINSQNEIISGKLTTLQAAQRRQSSANSAVQTKKTAYENAPSGNDTAGKETAYTNAANAVTTAMTNENTYQVAVGVQYNANTAKTNAATAKTNATTALTNADTKATTLIGETFTANKNFMEAAAVANSTLSTSEFTAMNDAWSAYKNTPAPSTSTTPVTATDTLVANYTTFTDKKTAYSTAVIASLKTKTASSSTDSKYISDNNTIASTFGVTTKYNEMSTAWNTLKTTVNGTDTSTAITDYNTFITKKTAYSAALTTAAQTAVANGTTAASTWASQQELYRAATKAVTDTQGAYNNAQQIADEATTLKNNYEDAIAQQNEARTTLTNATTALVNADSAANEPLNNAFVNDTAFMSKAANTTINDDVNSKYTPMKTAWDTYTAARTALNAIDAGKVAEISRATNTLLAAYNTFTSKKTAYTSAVKTAIEGLNTAINTYFTENQADATTFGVTSQYTNMTSAWTAVTTSLTGTDINQIITKYNTFVTNKDAFASALNTAKQLAAVAAAERRAREAKASNDAWIAASTTGARNLVSASSDMILNGCKDDEYLSGYSKVFDSYQYTCRIIPVGAKGNKGATGLPGLDGTAGAAGPDGPKGPQGPEGAMGTKGNPGLTGAAGSKGTIGPNGAKGLTGPKGNKGADLKTSFPIKQVAGPQGPEGPAGAIGGAGPKGPAGVADAPMIETPSPAAPPTRLDKTLSLLKLNNQMRDFLSKRQYQQEYTYDSPSMMQGKFYEEATYIY